MEVATKRAVIIGVDNYEDQRIPALEGAVNDAEEVHQRLTAEDEFEIKPEHFLTNREATSDAIRTAVSDVLWRTDQSDLVLIYFSGHGFDDEYGNGFLAPWDMDYERPLVRGVRMQELNDLIRLAKNKDVVLLILDACRSGIAAAGDKGQAPVPGALQDAFTLGEEDEGGGQGRIVLASSGPDEKSREKKDCTHQLGSAQEPHPHGAFTFQLLEGLDGGAAGEDEYVTLFGLHSFIEEHLGEDVQNQTPTFFGAGLQRASQIRLVKASQSADVVRILDEARRSMDDRTPVSLFLVIEELIGLHEVAARHPDAKELIRSIDARLAIERSKANMYMLRKKLDLRKQCPKTAVRLEDLVQDVAFDHLLREDTGMLGLMLGLWEACFAPDNDKHAYRRWLSQMSGYEVEIVGPTQVSSGTRGAK